MAVFVSKIPHCLFEILSRWQSGEWEVEIPLIISNHRDMEAIAKRFNVDFHFFEINKENKKEQENKQMELLRHLKIDFLVLARYMQILSDDFLNNFPNKIINIHHSFLPAFPGAKPYHQAFEKGVKIIGATSHYATRELDTGPIIEQSVTRITHRDSIKDLIRKGQDLEKIVLAKAIWYHLKRRILVYNKRTIVFD
ncbi:MAG: hypothetical protein ACD_79C00305G0002 [uncultured bacterium]|nr:MAG: hypothetical protein ACD_79C00305G0002 [uncultured bacterium]